MMDKELPYLFFLECLCNRVISKTKESISVQFYAKGKSNDIIDYYVKSCTPPIMKWKKKKQSQCLGKKTDLTSGSQI